MKDRPTNNSESLGLFEKTKKRKKNPDLKKVRTRGKIVVEDDEKLANRKRAQKLQGIAADYDDWDEDDHVIFDYRRR